MSQWYLSEYQCSSCWKLQAITDKINEIKRFSTEEGKLKEMSIMCLKKVIHITTEPKIAVQTMNCICITNRHYLPLRINLHFTLK